MKIKTLLLASLLGFTLNLNAAEKIVVAATPVPHAEILNQAKGELEKEGYTLVVKEFTDYVLPNLATDNGEVDANFFQHTPYLEEFNKNKGTKLVKVANIHIEPMAVYSKKYKSFDELKDGAKIAVPNDPTNESRALELLAKAGLIKLNDKKLKTPLDIVDNPKKLQFVELKAAQLPRALSDVDVAVINSNYALGANLNPVKDSIFIEDKDSPYVNFVVVRAEDSQSAKTKVIDKVLRSEKLRNFIEENYKDILIPGF